MNGKSSRQWLIVVKWDTDKVSQIEEQKSSVPPDTASWTH